MPVTGPPDHLVRILKYTIVALVHRDGPDLTARQLSLFLTIHLDEGPHTMHGLAAFLNVSKPAITRGIDHLEELDLARRKVNPKDRRSVHIQCTVKGAALLREMSAIISEAAASEQSAEASIAPQQAGGS